MGTVLSNVLLSQQPWINMLLTVAVCACVCVSTLPQWSSAFELYCSVCIVTCISAIVYRSRVFLWRAFRTLTTCKTHVCSCFNELFNKLRRKKGVSLINNVLPFFTACLSLFCHYSPIAIIPIQFPLLDIFITYRGNNRGNIFYTIMISPLRSMVFILILYHVTNRIFYVEIIIHWWPNYKIYP